MLYDKVNFTSDISYLNNIFIYEYDISKANISILYLKGVIDKNTYDKLYVAERMTRQVFIGKLQKDDNVTKILKAGIIEAKKMLFEANNINDTDVLSIKNDAIFIINKKLQYTAFCDGLIDFKNKNIYTSYYKINNLEMYYYYNQITKEEVLDIKGISDKNLVKHDKYMLQLLKDIFYTIQINGVEIAIRMLKDFYMDYINYNLDIGYYRKLDAQCMYHYKCNTFVGTGFEADYVDEQYKNALDISYNISILMSLQKILMSMYFVKHK